LVERGRALLDLRRPREAIPWLQKAVTADPDNYLARCDLALALFRLGELRAAIHAADQAAAINPSLAWPHFLRTLAYLSLGKRKLALLAAREAVRLEPGGADALYALAFAQMTNRQRLEARATAERLRQAAPHEARSHELLGWIARRRWRWKEAEAHYRQALALDPESTSAIAGLALVLEHRGKRREAIGLLQQAVRSRPDDPDLAWQMVRTVDRFRSRLPVLVVLALILLDSAAVIAWITVTTLVGSAIIGSFFLFMLWLLLWFGLLVAAHVLYLRRRLRRALPPAVVTFRDLTWKRWKQEAEASQLVLTFGLPLSCWHLAVRAARFVYRRWRARVRS
jgi:tetratricopeptide (TPR) repeat protein